MCGLSIHGTWAQMPLSVCGILVPGPRIEPVSPVLVGQFLSTGPPGKSPHSFYSNVKELG